MAVEGHAPGHAPSQTAGRTRWPPRHRIRSSAAQRGGIQPARLGPGAGRSASSRDSAAPAAQEPCQAAQGPCQAAQGPCQAAQGLFGGSDDCRRVSHPAAPRAVSLPSRCFRVRDSDRPDGLAARVIRASPHTPCTEAGYGPRAPGRLPVSTLGAVRHQSPSAPQVPTAGPGLLRPVLVRDQASRHASPRGSPALFLWLRCSEFIFSLG